ncbi:guanido phosphotransferase ATP [Thermacetogenium phaeum DSM 12270]|uniref:Protein-arginine kinase n=1 Tax=Thermacetogenium phaeum (strain ATCC BAA-254 / DSM 26808 / PB) TaxID=1089553 RepID=K4LCW4_THEPS|nr:guanido phosphotransferase ATP [Thermacetogenium phaeum DSM 12270]
MSIENALKNPYTKWMEGKGPYASIVISSRVRLARNLVDYPFPHVQNRDAGKKVAFLVRDAVLDPRFRQQVGGVDFVFLNELSPLDRMVLVEKHLISPQHAAEEGPERGLALSDDEAVSIMVNEEDHLRIQVLFPALQLEEAWELASGVDDALESRLEYAFDERYGYLTCCPTNVGTGLRASVMVHLPAVAMTNQANRLFTALSKLGFVVRGLYGEGTEARGNLFQVSNQITLGPSEEEIIGNLASVCRQIIEQEEMAREKLRKDALTQLEDMVFRSYGILSNAYIISSEEAMVHLSNVRLGLDMGLLRNVNIRKLNELLVEIRPAFLQKLAGEEIDAFKRDFKRAEIIRSALA